MSSGGRAQSQFSAHHAMFLLRVTTERMMHQAVLLRLEKAVSQLNGFVPWWHYLSLHAFRKFRVPPLHTSPSLKTRYSFTRASSTPYYCSDDFLGDQR